MKVKKINPEWRPSENKDLKVGDIIEITDPKQLIVNGDVVAVNEDNLEVSAFDLYGVVVKSEMDEFIEFKKMQQAEALRKKLEDEKKELESMKSKLDETKTETSSTEEVKKVEKKK